MKVCYVFRANLSHACMRIQHCNTAKLKIETRRHVHKLITQEGTDCICAQAQVRHNTKFPLVYIRMTETIHFLHTYEFQDRLTHRLHLTLKFLRDRDLFLKALRDNVKKKFPR